MSLLLDNATIPIKLGLEDFNSDAPHRLLSAARNLYAGILLLYKAKLSSLSPAGSDEVLIKQTIIPKKDARGHITFIGSGEKLGDVLELVEFLCIPLLHRLVNRRTRHP